MPLSCMNPPHTSIRALAALLLCLLLWPTAVAAQDSISDIRKQREEARDARAAALAEVDLLELQDGEIAEVLAEIQGSVDAQVAQVQGARQAFDSAIEEVTNREARAADASLALTETSRRIADRAVEAYVGSSVGVEPWLVSADLNRTAIRLAFLDFTAGTDRDLLDRLRRLEAQRGEDLLAGVEAQKEADELRVTLEADLTQLEERRRIEDSVRAEVQSRIDDWQASAADLDREANDMTSLIQQKQAEALGFPSGSSGVESVKGFVFPKSGRISSKFGPRSHPIFGSTRSHPGVDITGRTGEPIWASKSGRVIFAGRRGGYGNAVVIQHDGNISTLYAHMSELKASQGDWVEQGEVIGLTGTTGFSTGPHLHFEVRVNGVPKDPQIFLPG